MIQRKITLLIGLVGLVVLAGGSVVSAQNQTRTIINNGSETVNTGGNTKVGHSAKCVATSTQNGVVNTATNDCPGGAPNSTSDQLSPEQQQKVNESRDAYTQELSQTTQSRVAQLLGQYSDNANNRATDANNPSQANNQNANNDAANTPVTIPVVPEDRCEAAKAKLQAQFTRIKQKAEQHQQRFDDVTAKIEQYVASTDLPAGTVDQLLLGVNEARNKVDVSTGALESIDTEIDCSQAQNAAGNALAFRAVTESVATDLRGYQDNIKQLIEQLRNR